MTNNITLNETELQNGGQVVDNILKLQKLEPLKMMGIKAERQNNLIKVEIGSTDSVEELIEILDENEEINFNYSQELSSPTAITIQIEGNTEDRELIAFTNTICGHFSEVDGETIEANSMKAEINKQVYVAMQNAITGLGFELPAKIAEMDNNVAKIVATLPDQLEQQIKTNYPTVILYETAVNKFKNTLLNIAHTIILEQENAYIRENPFEALNQINARYGHDDEVITPQNVTADSIKNLKKNIYATTKYGRLANKIETFQTTRNLDSFETDLQESINEFSSDNSDFGDNIILNSINSLVEFIEETPNNHENVYLILDKLNALFVLSTKRIISRIKNETVLMDIQRLETIYSVITSNRYNQHAVLSAYETEIEDDYVEDEDEERL